MKIGNIKGFFSGVLFTLVIIGLSFTAYAANETRQVSAAYRDIKLLVNGTEVTPKDTNGNIVEPFIINGTTYLPVRALAEALGQKVDWDDPNATVVISTPAQSGGFTLRAGSYVVGQDIAPGTYDLSAVSGFGNVIGTVSSLPLSSLNEILGASGTFYEDQQTFNNLRVANGDTITISGSLVLRFTQK